VTYKEGENLPTYVVDPAFARYQFALHETRWSNKVPAKWCEQYKCALVGSLYMKYFPCKFL